MELFKLFGTIAVKNDEANQNIDETTNKAKKSENKMSAAFKKIGAAVATHFAVDKIKDFGKELVNVAAEVSAESSAFEQIMGNYSDQASEKVGKIAEATGMVSSRLTPYMTSMTAKFKGLGYDIDDATDLASDGLTLAADAAAFWDKSLDDSTSALNSFINGSYEGGEAIGLFANDTQLASYAVKNGIVSETKEWANLDEARKQATRLEYAQSMFATSGATGQAAKEADQYANVQANLNEKWRQFKGQIGEPLLENVVLPAMQKLSGLVDKLSPAFENLQQWVSENSEMLKTLAGVIAVVVAGVIGYKAAVTAVTIAQCALNIAMNLTPFQIIVTAIAALVAAFVILWNKSEGFRSFWIGLWDGIKNAVGAVVDWVKENWQAMLLFLINPLAGIFKYCYEHFEGFRNFVDNVINSVKGFFVDLWNKVTEVFTSIVNVAKNAWNGIKNVFSSVGSWFKGIFQGAYNAITGVFSGFASFFSNLWGKIKDTFSKLGTAISDAIGGAIKAGINGVIGFIERTINKAIGLINGAIGIINKIPGVNIKEISELKMPRLAKGGIVDKPTIAQVGENGKEAIVPLEKNTEWMDRVTDRLNASRKNDPAGNETIIRKLDEMIEAIKKLKIYLDSGVLVGELAPAMDGELGSINRLRVRGQ